MDSLVIKDVECRLREDGMCELNLEHVARGLGFTTVAASGNDCVRWARVDKYLTEFGFSKELGGGFIPENIFYKLCFKAKNEVAK